MKLPSGLIFSFSLQACAESGRGYLTGEEKDFLQYDCERRNGSSVACSFIHVTMSPMLEAQELDARVRESLPKVMSGLTTEDLADVCAYAAPISDLVIALKSGEANAVSEVLHTIPADLMDALNIDDAMARIRAVDDRKIQNIVSYSTHLSAICEDPSRANVEAFLRHDGETLARTCDLTILEFEGTFAQVSDRIWSTERRDPSGLCAVVRLDRFECSRNSASCDLVIERRVLNPDAKGTFGFPCRDWEEISRYTHSAENVHLDRDRVSFP